MEVWLNFIFQFLLWWEKIFFVSRSWVTHHLRKSVHILCTQTSKCQQTSWSKKNVIEVPWEIYLTHLKNSKVHQRILEKLCSVLARHMWWFWNRLLFGIKRKFTVWRSYREISWEKVEHLTFDWKVKWSSHVDFIKKLFASLPEFLLWNTELKESKTLGKIFVASFFNGDFACWILQWDVM